DGVAARRLFEQAYELATNHTPAQTGLTKIAAHAVENLMLLSLSPEECERRAAQLTALAPQEPVLQELLPDIRDLVRRGHPWYGAMLRIAGSYFDADPTRD